MKFWHNGKEALRSKEINILSSLAALNHKSQNAVIYAPNIWSMELELAVIFFFFFVIWMIFFIFYFFWPNQLFSNFLFLIDLRLPHFWP